MRRSSGLTVRIAFLLPRLSRSPIGGYAVVYEHAAGLQRSGHDVSVIHVAAWTPPLARSVAAEGARRIAHRTGHRAAVTWSDVPGAAAHLRAPWRQLDRLDAVVVTSWLSAESAARRLPPERLTYLIQSDEHWSGPEQRVSATWQLPVHKVVIARWLLDLASDRGVTADYVPNAIDTSRFQVVAPIADRDPSRVLMLWHQHPVKGSDVAVATLTRARERVPGLRVTAFSIYGRPSDLPPWVDWVRRPDRRALADLYNQHAIFLSASRLEGWALPPAEAMASGCALVSTDIGGVRDYAIQEKTALLAPVADPDALADAVVRMASDHELRTRLAGDGAAMMRSEFSWGRSTAAFESALLRAHAGRTS